MGSAMLEIHKDLISLLRCCLHTLNPVIWQWQFYFLVPHPLAWRKYLAPESAKTHQSLALAQFMHRHLPYDRMKHQRNPPHYPHQHPPPGWCICYNWWTDVRDCACLGEGRVDGIALSQSCLLPAAAPTDLEEQVQRDTPVRVSSLWR